MWQIKYQDEFLDVRNEDGAEIERDSPLFGAEKLPAEKSTPITIPYSDKNSRLLGHYFFEQTYKIRKKMDVQLLYHDGTFKAEATLVIESAGMHTWDPKKRNASGYVLTGISDFYTRIKGKKMTELALGGVRTKPFTTNDPTDGSDGYWQMFHDTWDFTDDFVIAPIRNEFFTGVSDDPYATGYMNKLDTNSNLDTNQDVVPLVKVKYVLEQIFAEHGWSVDFSGLNDTQWEKLVLYSAYAIKTRTVTYSWSGMSLVATGTSVPSLSFSLSDAMPQDVTIAAWLNAICNRYGWAPVFDSGRKCRMIALKEMPAKASKHWSDYAMPAKSSQVVKDKKTFSFKNNFGGKDNYPSTPDFDGWTFGEPVASAEDLADVYGPVDKKLYYALKENAWYKATWDADLADRVWVVHADNIYDAEPTDGAEPTDVFETDCTTLPMVKTLYRTDGGIDYYGYFPYCEQSQFEPWGIRTLLYHGLKYEIKADGTTGPNQYPFVSSTRQTPLTGDGELTWSNVYRQEYGGTDYGIIEYWYRKWMDYILSNEEDVDIGFRLPLHEYAAFKFDDPVIVNGQQYLLKNILEKPAMKGIVEIQAKAQKIISKYNINLGIIYAKLVQEEVLTDQYEEVTVFSTTYIYDNMTKAKLRIYLYSDAAGTVPVDGDGLKVYVRYKTYRDGVLVATSVPYPTIITGSSQYYLALNIYYSLLFDYSISGSGIDPVNYEYVYEIVANNAYQIIP